MIARSLARTACLMCATVAFLMIPGPSASADPIEVVATPGTSLQQLLNRPCIFGDPSCHNPASFSYTVLDPNDPSGTFSSPTYTVDQIREMVGGNTFYVGLDLNQAMGHNGGAYMLHSFSLNVDGTPFYATSAPTKLTPLHPGNGHSDATIGFFDLTGLSGSQTLVFATSFTGATGGREQFFLIPADGGQPGTSPAPEPATMLLIGTGLAGVAAIRRRRQQAKAV